MNNAPPRLGLVWIREGFGLFRKRPFLLTSLFLGYFTISVIIGLIPIAGQIIPILVLPSFSMLFMYACWKISEGHEIRAQEAAYIFRSPYTWRLILLGVVYLLAIIVSLLCASVMDNGALWKLMISGNQMTPQELQQSNSMSGLMVAAMLYSLITLLFWFAAPLIVWKNMPFIKACFFSFFAVLRAWKAMLVYVMGCILFAFLIPSLIYSLILIALGKLHFFVVMTIFIITSTLIYCTFYPIYVNIFGVPEKIEPETPETL